MGDQEEQSGDEVVVPDPRGGEVIDPPPQVPQYRIWREQGASIWQLSGLQADEARSLTIIFQGVKNAKSAITKSKKNWLLGFNKADKALVLTMGFLEDLIKDEVTSSRAPYEATQKILAHFTHYRGLLDEWLFWVSPTLTLSSVQMSTMISIEKYRQK